METCENMEQFPKFIEFLRNEVEPMMALAGIFQQVYIVYLGHKDSKATHPKIVKKIREGEFVIGKGSLIVPGFSEPAAVTTLIPVQGSKTKMQTFVMGSAASNFHKFMGAGVTLRSLGCKDLPEDLLDVVFTTAEQVIQAWKAVVAYKFEVFRGEGPEEQHAEAFNKLMAEKDCKQQKKLGRLVKVNFAKYGPTAGKISVWIYAFILAARIAGIVGLSSAVTMEISPLETSDGVATDAVEIPRTPLTATEGIEAAVESVTPREQPPAYVARFADEEPVGAPIAAVPALVEQDDILTAPLDIPRADALDNDVDDE
jgi:hypothetical protein